MKRGEGSARTDVVSSDMIKRIKRWWREKEKLYEVYIVGPYGSEVKDGWGCNLYLSKPEIAKYEESGRYKCYILHPDDEQ